MANVPRMLRTELTVAVEWVLSLCIPSKARYGFSLSLMPYKQATAVLSTSFSLQHSFPFFTLKLHKPGS
jgi:hypothetical protein